MIIAVTILSVLLFITLITSLACVAHIIKINKELSSMSEEQSQQNEDIRNLMVSQMEVIKALQYAASLETKNQPHILWSNIKGEA
jgi:hypothetical protein